MGSESTGHTTSSREGLPSLPKPRKRLPLSGSRHRLSFERRIRIWLYLLGLPVFVLTGLLLRQYHAESLIEAIALACLVIVWAFLVSLFADQIIRPLQTLANVVAALREDDYSFRARGGRRNDAMGDLALEINALAGMLQSQRAGAMEAMALVDRVMKSMQSPVLAFDVEGRLKLLNSAAERVFSLKLGDKSAEPRTSLDALLRSGDNDLLSLGTPSRPVRWVVKRSSFRLRGIPHHLFVLSDVSEALREEERVAWERLIRVLGHEINNSLTPIKSIAGSLRTRLIKQAIGLEDWEDFSRGLEVIEDRAESLNRFLQAYRELMGLPAPRMEDVLLPTLVKRVAQLETRIEVGVIASAQITIRVDPDQLAQALINLIRNATEAAMSHHASSPTVSPGRNAPKVEVTWEIADGEIVIAILDNGAGLSNASNLFVPFYTTKPGGTGIGLVLAQQIAMGHGGSVQLVNRADRSGCRAVLRLPGNSPSPK